MYDREQEDCCCKAQLSMQQNQEVIFTLENLLMKNKILSKRMVALIKETDENGEKMMQIMKKVPKFSGNNSGMKVKGEFTLDENKNDPDILESLVNFNVDDDNEDEKDGCKPPTENDTPATYLSLPGRLANMNLYPIDRSVLRRTGP